MQKAGESTQTKTDKALSDHIRNKINLKKKKNFLQVTENAKTLCIYLVAHWVFASWLKDQLEHKYNVSNLEEHSAMALPGPFTPQGKDSIDLYHIRSLLMIKPLLSSSSNTNSVPKEVT